MTDYIDRQAAIDAINKAVTKEVARWSVKELPSVEVESAKRGKWIYDNQFHWYRASCSECGYKRVTDIKTEKWNGWKYCPNCGAKMEPISASPENGQEVDE